MRKFIVLLALTLLYPFMSWAQDNSPAPSQPESKSEPKPEWDPNWHVGLTGGYSLLRDADNSSGFSAGIAFRLAQSFNLRADFFTIHASSSSGVLIGPEFRPHLFRSEGASRIEPFFNTRVGSVRTTTTDNGHKLSAAWSVGGGFDLRVAKHFVLRPIDVNYLRANTYKEGRGSETYANHMQLSSGLVFRL